MGYLFQGAWFGGGYFGKDFHIIFRCVLQRGLSFQIPKRVIAIGLLDDAMPSVLFMCIRIALLRIFLDEFMTGSA